MPETKYTPFHPATWAKVPVFLFILAVLYVTTFINYLLFHSLVELFSVGVAFTLFVIAWNSRRFIDNDYLLFIGIAYLFIGFLDLMHTLTYKGMNIFTDYDFYANQLWIAARFMESLSLCAGFVFLFHKKRLNPHGVLALFVFVTGVLIASIFYWKVFPVCFVEGQGLTPFKIYSEYVICAILLIDIMMLKLFRKKFDEQVYKFLAISISCTIFSELAFTFYVSNYGFSNLVGHYFKLVSFYFIYLSIVKTGIESPYKVVFRELSDTNTKLTQALEEIKTLKGILPICMHCKKIRDDQGYWNQIEVYIKDRSEAEFSHSICPECMKTHYPDVDMSGEGENGVP